MSDEEAREFLGPLAGEPDGPQRLDLAEIERVGGRRRRNRRLAAGGLTTLAVAAGCGAFFALQANSQPGTPAAGYEPPLPGSSAAVSPAAAGAKCLAAPLAGPTGRVYDVDHTGRYAVEVRGGRQKSAVVWKDGHQTATVALPHSDRVEIAVNATGDLALSLADGQKNPTPYAYAGGKLTPLKGGGVIADIADDGRIGGTSAAGKPVVWASPDAEPTQLPLPSGTIHGVVIGFDTDGTILSAALNNDNTRTVFLLWRNGTSHPETLTFPDQYGGGNPTIRGIRGGKIFYSNPPTAVFSYDIITRQVTKLPQQAAFTQGIGGEGTVVGAPTDAVPLWAVIDGKAYEFSTLEGLAQYSLVTVADDGHTMFGNSWQDSTAHPTKWTCGLASLPRAR
ncbi:hypothetical protein ACIA5C_46520 [Actinoplanes sp. NPDC051343]|uniref:hypothetical protein n=1 Tax=Actinoplanes sp. NPDC051343 TaxID=3363906 RepID=UPI0037BAA47C